MKAPEFARLTARAASLAEQHLYGAPEGRGFRPMTPAQRERVLSQPFPETGVAPDALFDFFESAVLPHPMGNGSRRFFGWVNSPPSELAVAGGDPGGSDESELCGGDHAAIYLEHCVTRWLRELLGFPLEGSAGLLVSGGSMASLTGLAAARHRIFERAGINVRTEGVQALGKPLSLFMTDQGHSCIRKAVELLGLGSNAIRTVPVDSDLRMRPDALREMIQQDRDAGRVPFCVVASAGDSEYGNDRSAGRDQPRVRAGRAVVSY